MADTKDNAGDFRLSTRPLPKRKKDGRRLPAKDRTEKHCRICGQTKPVSEFHKAKHNNDGLSNYCKVCQSAYHAGRMRLYHGRRWPIVLVTNARNSAKKRGQGFDITVEDVVAMYKAQGGLCYWFSVPLVPELGRRFPQTPSLDRLDCSLGYIKGNVVLACLGANFARSNNDVETFRQFCAVLRAAADGAPVDPTDSKVYSPGNDPIPMQKDLLMPDFESLTIARRLNQLRERAGLGMNETARRAGMAQEQAWRIFDGRNTNPTIQTLERLVMAMGFTLRDLFADDPPENPSDSPEGA